MNKKEYLEEIWSKRITARLENGQETRPLIEVVAGHDQALSPESIPVGVTPDSSVLKMTGGMNGKRCIYAVQTSDSNWIAARGTYMGQQSSFWFVSIEDATRSLLTSEEQTRLNFLPDSEEKGKVYFGFALADSMLPEGRIEKRSMTSFDRDFYFSGKGGEVVPCLNPSHAATIAAMKERYGIDVLIPETPPQVKLKKGDSLIVMGVRGLPRMVDRHEYTTEEIAGAEFNFSLYRV